MAQSAIPGLDINDPGAERAARRMRSPVSTPEVMYGTQQGVALDRGAAEAVRQRPVPTVVNPNVPPGGSADARSFRAPPNSGPQPAAAVPAQPAAPTWQTAWRSMRAGASDAVRGVAKAGIPGALGALTGAQQAAADTMNPDTPFVPPEAKPGDIPTGGVTAPPAIRQHPLGFGPDNEFTRNLANTINAVSGVGRGLGAGISAVNSLRAGSNAGVVAQRLGQVAAPVAPFVQGAQAAQPLVASALAGGDAPAAPQPTASPFTPNANGQPGGTLPGAGVPMPPNPAGTIRRVGNSYSADGPIAFGADIDNPRNPGAGVTSLDMSEGRRQDALELGRMRERPQSVTTGDGGGTLGQGPIGFGGSTLAEGLRAKHFSTPSASILSPGTSNMKPRDIRAANALAAEQAIATARMANERGVASMREGGDMARAQLGANVQRENNAATTNATMRGQDLNYQGHVLSVRQAQAAAQRAQANTDREYMRATGNDDFSRQSTAQADHNKWVESTFITKDADGKSVPDTQKIGDFNNTAQASVGALVAQLRQSGDPAAIAKAEKLARQGLAGLDAEDRALMKTLYDRRERHMQTRGVGPGSGTGPVSNNLLDYALTGQTKGLVQNTVQMRGGQSIPENDLRYTAPANAILPDWFKTPTTALGPTPQEQRRMREGGQ